MKPTSSKVDHFVKFFDSAKHASEAYNDDLLKSFGSSEQLSDANFVREISSRYCESEIVIENHDVVLAINSLKTYSAPGLDEVSPWFLKHFAIYFVVPLCHVYNLSVKLGKFHDMWKEAVVVPLPKCTCPKLASNLRPSSLTSIFTKVLEKIIYFKTQGFWQSVINKDQFAYRPLCSITSALTLLTHNWLQFLDEHKQGLIRILAIDFSKAFDTVDHSLLIGKLCSYGAPYWLINVLLDYFNGRTQRVRINGQLSTPGIVARGIPQGTVLSPVLFSVYTNDLVPRHHDRTSVIKYADDQTWSHMIPNHYSDDAHLEIENIYRWCVDNRMKLN